MPIQSVKGLTMESKRALLIGINQYAHFRSLSGCLNDVALMESILAEHFGFSMEKIGVV